MREFLSKVVCQINQKRRGLIYLVGLFCVYGLLKTIVYLAPLFLNHILGNVRRFGEFEYSLNLGQTFSTIIALGLPNAYAYFIYKEKETKLNGVFHNIYFIAFALISVIGIFVPRSFNNLYFNAAIIGMAIANQLFITTYYKLKGKNFLAVIIDCGVYILLLVFAFLIYRGIFTYKISSWSYIILGYTFVMVAAYHYKNIGHFRSVERSDWLRVLKYGVQIVVALFLISLLTTSTRIYIEYFTDFSFVGIYSLFIRIASAIIIFHRVIVILLYRKIYSDAHSKLDNYFAALILMALLGGILLYLIVPNLAPKVIPNFIPAKKESGNIFFLWTILQAVSWTSVAVLELIIYREYKLSKYIRLLLTVLVSMILLFLSYDHILNLTAMDILKINVLAVVSIGFGQIIILKRQIYYYRNTLLAHSLMTLVVITSLFLT